MDGNNNINQNIPPVNNNVPPVNNGVPNVNSNVPPNQNQNPNYRLVIDEKPYRRRSLIPMLVMGLLFLGIAFGIKTLIFAVIGVEDPFDPTNVETRKFEDIINDKNVAFYISGDIYTTRLSPDAEIIEISNNVGYSLVRDSLYYKYYFRNSSGITFDKDNYYVDNKAYLVNCINEKEGLVATIEHLEQNGMDTASMKKMCSDFVSNTKKSASSTPITEYLKHSIIYGYKADLNFIKKVRYFKDYDERKLFEFEGGGIVLSLKSTNKDISNSEEKDFGDGVKIYSEDNNHYIHLDNNLFEISVAKTNEEEKNVTFTVEEIHDYFVKSLKKN